MKVDLLSNVAATGADVVFSGGRAVFVSEANWGGGTVKLQMKTNQGTYIDVTGASHTANTVSGVLYLPPGTYRAHVATATAIYAFLIGV